jgi:hypothetical protein
MEFLRKNEIKGMTCDMSKPFAFISYSHDEHDAQIVMNVFKKLYERGYNLWIDTANMPVSEDSWKKSAMNALRNKACCKRAVYFRSESSMIKETIAAELETIKDLKHIGPIITVDIWKDPKLDAKTYQRNILNGDSDSEYENCRRICDIVNPENKAIRLASDLANNVNSLADEIAEELESKGVESSKGKTVSEMTVDTEPASAQETEKEMEKESEKEPDIKESETGDKSLVYFMGAMAEIVSDNQVVLKSGSLVTKTVSDSCTDKARRLREEAIKTGKLVEDGADYRLTEDITFKNQSGAATFVCGYPMNGAAAWKEHKATRTRRAPIPKVSPSITNPELPAGTVVYVKDHPQDEAQMSENGGVRYKGRELSLNQFVLLILGPGSSNANLYIVEKNSGKLLSELMNENGGEPEHEKEPESNKCVAPEPVASSGKDVTIQQVREMCMVPLTLFDFREVRTNMPRGGMGSMDYAMTAILGGCNGVTVKSPVYQINYYSYVISKTDDPSKKDGAGLGATWTWSSNCRKVLGLEKSGAIPKEINDYFAGLDGNTTLGELEAKFKEGTEEPFATKKNDLVILAIQNIRDFVNKNQL